MVPTQKFFGDKLDVKCFMGFIQYSCIYRWIVHHVEDDANAARAIL